MMDQQKEKAGIFIVEDEVLIAADIQKQLESLGYEVLGRAVSAEKALDLIELGGPDLVLMDIVLAGEMDGIEAAEIIRSKWGLPVVFLTSHADTDRLERAKLACPFGYILKPFHGRDLGITIEMALYSAGVDRERKKTKDKLQIYKHIVSSTQDGISYLDKDYRYRIVNDAYEKYSGRNKETFLGLTIGEYLGEEIFQTEIKEKFDRCLQGEAIHFQGTFEYPNLGQRHVLVTYSPYIGSQGKIEGVVATTRDITEQKRAEQALRESEKKYRQLFDQAPAGIFEIDLLRHRLLDVNEVACQQLGYTRRELMNLNPMDLLGEDIRRHLAELTGQNGRPREVSVHVECELVGQNDRRFWALLTVRLKYENNEAVGASVVVNDITKRKLMENLARKNEERFRLIANNSVDSAFFHDRDLKYIWITKAFAPFSIEQILGRTDRSLMGDDYGGKLFEFKREVLERKRQMRSEFVIPMPAGRLSFYEITCSPRTNLDGAIIGLSGFMRDITARREAEEEIRQRETLLQQERKSLEEANAAFKLLLKHRDEEKQRQTEELTGNIKKLVLPYFDRLKNTRLDQSQLDLVDIIENSLASVTSRVFGGRPGRSGKPDPQGIGGGRLD